MKLQSQLKYAFFNLITSKLRTLLTLVGIMVGTASVVTLISSGQLATQQALEQFKGLGTELMSIDFSPTTQTDFKVTAAMMKSMQLSIPELEQVAPFSATSLPASLQQQVLETVNIIGVTHNIADIVNIKLKKGRFISDLDKSQFFCVLGQKVVANLKISSPIGQHIKLGNAIFTIIGVADSWRENIFFHQDVNNSVIISMDAMKFLAPEANLGAAIIKLKKNVDIDSVKKKINEYFSKNIPGFQINFQSGKEILARMAAQQAILSLLLGLIGGITLLVSGIGVMNIMLATVAERRNEIGLRLALGAQPKNIQLMFLAEAAVLALIGGGLGVILGILSSFIVAQIAGWAFTIFLLPAVIGFSVSLLVSLFFGFYPAYLASKLNPIDALKAS